MSLALAAVVVALAAAGPVDERVQQAAAPPEVSADEPRVEGTPREDKPVAVACDATAGARIGVSAGNVLAAPFVIPGPGAFFSLAERTELFHVVDVGLDGSIAAGLNTGDSLPVAGYKARLLVGFALHAFDDVLTWRGDVHGGVTSIALFPAPRVGVGTELALAAPINEWLFFDAKARFDGDVVVIAPAPAFAVDVGLRAKVGPVYFGVKGGGDVDAIVAVVANTISASASVALFAGADI